MSYLHQMKPKPSSRKRRKRVGRGQGSTLGKTSGRGHKGQKQHGKPPRPGFEGGQMPLIRTMPKRGFTAQSRPSYQVLNLKDLSRFSKEKEINLALLNEQSLIKGPLPLKVLGEGDLKRAITIEAHAFSKSALEKIKKAGGEAKIRPVR